MYFGNKSISIHLMRGALGLLALFVSLWLFGRSMWIGFAVLAVAVYLLKGCPMCWLLGLVETVARVLNKHPQIPDKQCGGIE